MYATMRLLWREVLSWDAAAALRSVLLGDIVTERRLEVEDQFQRFWVCPKWTSCRAEALGEAPGWAAAWGQALPRAFAITGIQALDPHLVSLHQSAIAVPLPAQPQFAAGCCLD